MRDRSAFIRQTPERVRPLTFYAPLYKDGSIPVWKAKLGLAMLERLDPGGVPLHIRTIPPDEARAHPALSHLRDPNRLLGVMSFTEHQFDWPERICLDTIENACDAGAEARNYVRVDHVTRDRAGLWSVEAVDLRSGGAVEAKAKAFVNAAGAWIDEVARAGDLEVPRLNQGAKDCNVVVRLPPEFHGQGFETIMRDGHPFYVVPWDDLHFFGPVDAPAEPTEENARPREEEVDRLLAEMNHLLPSLRLARRDVLYAWAGVRPRTYDPRHTAGGMTTELHDFSRRGLANYYAFTGALIMTHRHAGRAITAAVAGRVAPSGRSQTVNHASRFLDTANEAPIRPHYPGVHPSDLRYDAAREDARTLQDVMFRRVRLGWTERMGADVVDEVAETVRGAFGWSAAEAARQANSYREYLSSEFSLRN